MNRAKIIALSVVCVVCICIIGFSVATILRDSNGNLNTSGDVLGVTDSGESGEFAQISGEDSGEEIEEVYNGPTIFSGDARPVAIMIDNEKGAWPQAGLNDAYMIYEIVVEGGETRFIAFFKGQNTSKVGPVRSSRHYFLDYVLEHDAIYVHFGWSPLAQSNIKSLGINNINGIYDNFYWREAPKSSYHNAFTSFENISKYISAKKYRRTSDKDCIIKFNQKDTDIESEMTANEINIKYSYIQNTSYVYDKERKVYLRSMRGIEHRDRWTNEQFYAKNIVIIYVKDVLLDDPEDKGRRELYNTGEGKGYYVTNGEYEPITWKKETRSGRTVYYDLQGNEIKFNDGITWVQIVPKDASVVIN